MSEVKHRLLHYLPQALFFFILAGIGVSELKPALSNYYWYGLCALFAIAYTAVGSSLAGHEPLYKHLLHWLGAGITILVVFLFQHNGLINPNQAALFNIVVIGLAAYTDGLRIHINLSLVGLYMLALAVIMSLVSEYIWLFVGLTVLLIAAQWYWGHRGAKATSNTVHQEPEKSDKPHDIENLFDADTSARPARENQASAPTQENKH